VALAPAVPCAADECDKDGKDHPLISRYQGSCIYTYSQREFDEFTLPLGKVVNNKFAKSQHVEGKVTCLEYNMPEHRTVLEVFRNYQSGLKQGGFETLYTCAGPECISGNANDVQRVYAGGDSRYEPGWADAESHNLRFLSAKLPRLVKVDAASLASDINRTGHASVYGIYFDTAKADIKPESDGTMKEIGKLMQGDPTLQLYVVGHTDNQGGLDMNMDLSRRRAQSVLAALTTKYAVPAGRLKSFGAGPYSPVASNDSEDGRAKNRRVELVKQ